MHEPPLGERVGLTLRANRRSRIKYRCLTKGTSCAFCNPSILFFREFSTTPGSSCTINLALYL